MKNAYAQVSTRKTPQSQPVMGRTDMSPNNAGGYGFNVNDWQRLDRFLILGSEGGTYYVAEQALTLQNAEATLRCIAADGARAVECIAAVSEGGLAPKNDPAIFALALAASHGDGATRALALRALPRVCRIPTHLFSFVSYCQGHRGWGRGLRQAIRHWYGDMAPEKLAYEVVKYQQRNGWSNRDLLRLAHPTPHGEVQAAIYRWIVKGLLTENAPRIIAAFEDAKAVTDMKELAGMVRTDGLPREALPTQALDRPEVWEALLEQMPMTAMVRNLAKMTAVGLLKPMGDATRRVVSRLGDGEALARARLHPLTILSALAVYQQGHGKKGSLKWQPVREVVEALDAAFYLAFRAVVPTGKRIVLGVDVSGSMSGTPTAGLPHVSCDLAAAAMALVTAATERDWVVVPFDRQAYKLTIGPRQRLDDVMQAICALPHGGTDCAVPILVAAHERWPVDAFVIYTDSETWAGEQHVYQALQEYRRITGIPARLVCVAMAANHTSIADPTDPLMLNVVGFDASTPQVIGQFIAGALA